MTMSFVKIGIVMVWHCAKRAMAWTLLALGLASTFVSPVFASAFPIDLTNTASVTLPSGWEDSNLANNQAAQNLKKQARVRIQKIAQGGDGTFAFRSTHAALDAIEIATSAGEGLSDYTAVEDGSIQLSEEPQAGWTLKSVECSDPDGGTSVDSKTLAVSLDVDAHEDIECRFLNQKNARFTLIKKTEGGDGRFDFQNDLSVTAQNLETNPITTQNGEGLVVFDDVRPGQHQIIEVQQPGWDLTDVQCSVADASKLTLPEDTDADGVLDTSEVRLELQPAEGGSCTFVNRKAVPKLNVTKSITSAPKYEGDDTYSVDVRIAVANTGNTPVTLNAVRDDLVSAFQGQALVRGVGDPIYSLNDNGFAAPLNTVFDGGTGLEGNTANLLQSAAKLGVGHVVEVQFQVLFEPLVKAMSVDNIATASGLGSGLPVDDQSHNAANALEEGDTPTPIAIDPSGIIYDSINRNPVSGAVVRLVDAVGQALPATCLASGQQGQTTGADGFYRFDINVGAHPACPVSETQYRIDVEAPDGFTFESVLRPVSGDIFEATSCPTTDGICKIDDAFATISSIDAYEYYLDYLIQSNDPDIVLNHIPLDPAAVAGDFSISKSAQVSSGTVGDIVPFELKIKNETDRPLSNFSVLDRLPVGLSYVPNTAILVNGGQSQSAEPDAANGALRWSFSPSATSGQSQLSASSEMRLTFQTRIVAFESEGTLVNTAVVVNSANDEVSNQAKASLYLRPEPIFHCSSVFGRVFFDENQNGIMDQAERGIANARLHTLKGEWITADAHGRYHVPCAMVPQDRIGSNYALKLQASSLQQSQIPPAQNPKIVRLTPGISSVVNFAVTTGEKERDGFGEALFGLPIFAENQKELAAKHATETGSQANAQAPLYLAMVDLTAKQKLASQLGSGSNSETQIEGRLAIYLKGYVKGDALLTVMADTGEGAVQGLFDDFMERDAKAYLKRIDTDRYYPVFGDDSRLIEDAPTSGKLYVRLEKGENRAVWGSVRAELKDSAFVRANRIFYGAKLHLESPTDKATSSGKPRSEFDAYVAEPLSLKARDSFRAHNGTVFYTRHADIQPGSEVVVVEVRDAVTQIVKQQKTLVHGKDYSIDPILGRIVLDQPLPSALSSTSLFDLSGIQGDPIYLMVDYSYAGGIRNEAELNLGAQAKTWLTDKLQVRASAQRQRDADFNFDVASLGATLKTTEGTQLSIEVAQSRGSNADVSESEDGGFAWTTSQAGAQTDLSAQAVRVDLKAALSDFSQLQGHLNATYEARGAGFTDFSGTSKQDTQEATVNLSIELSETESLEAEASARQEAGNTSQPTSRGSISYTKQVDPDTQVAVSALAKSQGSETSTLLGGRIEKRLDPKLKVSAFGAVELGDKGQEDESFVGLGLSYDPVENLNVSLNVSVNKAGQSQANLRGEWQRDEASSYYLSYQFGGDSIESTHVDVPGLGSGQFVAGGAQKFGEHLSVYGEEILYLNQGTVDGSTHAYRLEWEDAKDWHAGLGFEYGEVSNKERLAIAASVRTLRDDLKSDTLLEYRRDLDQASKALTETLLARSRFERRVEDGWRYKLDLEGMKTQTRGRAENDGTYAKAQVAAAYRPETRDEWAALMMYTFLYDLPPEQQLEKGQFKQIAHLFSAEASYRVNPNLRLTAKYGLKAGRQTTDRDSQAWSKTLVQLGILRADLRLSQRFEALLEGRLMSIKEPEHLKKAFLGALYYRLDDQIKVGGGYTFGQTSDNLLNHNQNDKGWFANIVGAF